MLEEEGLTAYLMLAKLVENALEEGGYWERPKKTKLKLSSALQELQAQVTAPRPRRRRHSRRLR